MFGKATSQIRVAETEKGGSALSLTRPTFTPLSLNFTALLSNFTTLSDYFCTLSRIFITWLDNFCALADNFSAPSDVVGAFPKLLCRARGASSARKTMQLHACVSGVVYVDGVR